MSRKTHPWILAIAAALWLAATGVGFKLLLAYSLRPGAAAAAPESWPGWSRIPSPTGHAVLIMTIHPHCPCTSASVAELNTLMALLRDYNVKGYVLAVKPADFPESWIRTVSYRSAQNIPNVRVMVDDEGLEAMAFGAQTSGQVLLYDSQGRLQFAGGITPDRGHVGDSAGRQRILSLVKDGKSDAPESLVFGCPLGAASCPLPPKQARASLN